MFKMGNGWLIVRAFRDQFTIQRIRNFSYSERDKPDVIEEGNTTGISSVSIAVIVEMNQRAL